MLKIFNTLTRSVEEFKSANPPYVGMYSCGPTVYDYAHIGHLRRYIGDDVLKRLLGYQGYEVKHVMNITDVGHLTSDEDAGEDKMEKGAIKRGMTVWEVAKFFEDYFFKSIDQVNIIRPNIVSRATEHIKAQIDLIEALIKGGYTYQTKQAIYFDVSKFPNYEKLSKQKLEQKVVGVREEVIVDTEKRQPHDFVLWFFTVGRFKDHVMRWPSPWGEGFPGWHIECSAMSMVYLGKTLDIHTGGIDHIDVHHTNEIAQSEAATGVEFVKYWVHHNFLLVNGEKMSKSLGNFYTLGDVTKKGFDPISMRYLFLTGHYRDIMNFTWDSMQSAQNALNNLQDEVRFWDQPGEVNEEYMDKFKDMMNSDLNTPKALAVMWELVRADIATSSKSATLLEMDKILGLQLDQYVAKPFEIPAEVGELVEKREEARKNKNFEQSDKLRQKLEEQGYTVEDTPSGPKVKLKKS